MSGISKAWPSLKRDGRRACILTVAFVALMGASFAHAETPNSDDKGKILYYRNPMGLPDTSPMPKKDNMGMDYIPVYESERKDEAGTVQISPERIQKLGVRTEVISKRNLGQSVRAVGTVQIDERRQTVIAPRFEGWVEKLQADATGIQVKKGDPLFTFYSPDLTHIEAEYPFAHSQIMADMSGAMDPATRHPMNGTVERLQNLAVPQEEIVRLLHEKTANYHIIFRAPTDGTIMEKRAIEGMKFMSGDMLYRLVDLSNVWVMVDVYEQDLARVAVGQTATITITAFPGKTFEGKVGFIYPDINKDTRTARIRIDLPNPTGELRTDMYASVELGNGTENSVVAIPASAILNSGEKQIVLVDFGDGRFAPHQIKIGARGRDYAEVLEGLNEGDRVVTSANFLIDAESNMRAALQSFTAPEAKP